MTAVTASSAPTARRLAALPATLLLGAGLLAGCSGGDEPEPIVSSEAPSSAESPSGSASSAPPPSAAPEPWEKRTKAGAVAFVEHWVDVFNEAGASGDTTELRAISMVSGGCTSCGNYIELIDRVYGAGGSYESDGWTVEQTGLSGVSSRDQVAVVARVSVAPEILRERAGGPAKRTPQSEATYTFRVAWADGMWRLSDLDLLA